MGARLLGGLAGLVMTLALAVPADGAVISVTETADERNSDGDCSLREAVQSANDNSSVDDCAKGEGPGRVDTVKLKAADYDLTIPSTGESQNADGDLDYTGGGPLTILGKSDSETQISNQVDDRVLQSVEPGDVTLRIERLTIEDGEGFTGGNVYVAGGGLTLDRVDVDGGHAATYAGGVLYLSSGTLRIVRSTFFANQAELGGFGGGLYATGAGEAIIEDSTFFANDAGSNDDAAGGGVFTQMTPTEITDSTILANTATSLEDGTSRGGGIYSEDGGLQIRRSLVSANSAIEGMEAADAGGGGVFAAAAKTRNTIVNTTIHGNESDDAGAGFEGSASLSHVTFLANAADGSADHLLSDGGITLRNSILPGAEGLVDLCSDPDPVVSKGFNVATYDDADCAFLDSDVFGPVGLESSDPVDNGGPTETVAISGASPAKDLVPKGNCKVAKGEDQRGFERPRGPRCDAGAFERGAHP